MKKTKFCNKCKTERPLEEFSKCKSKKDGYNSTCKHCVKQYNIDNKEILLEKARVRMRKYRKENPEKVKKLSAFYRKTEKYKETNKKYRQTKKYKSYKKKYSKEYRQTDKGKEMSKKNSREWKRNNKSKVKKYRDKYQKTKEGKEVIAKASRKYSKNNSEKKKAQKILQKTIKDGLITRPKICEVCGKTNCLIDSHHDDYSKPLEVIFCCRICHYKLNEQRRQREELENNLTKIK